MYRRNREIKMDGSFILEINWTACKGQRKSETFYFLKMSVFLEFAE